MPRLTTRDYKRPSRSASAAKLKEFALGVVVGAVLASAAFLIAGARSRHHAVTSSHAHAGTGSQATSPRAPSADDNSSDGSDPTGSGASEAQPSSPAHASARAPQYDFYRMLPSFKVPVSHDDDHPSHAPPPPEAGESAHAVTAGPAYLLQVGSYRSASEADQVRARLARAGISAQVQHVAEGSRTWNRVRIGPLSDAELAKVREKLRTANIRALVIRADR